MLGVTVVATQKHGMRSRQPAGIDHQLAINRVERLDDLGVGKGLLNLFAERFESRTFRCQHVGDVNDNLPLEVRCAGGPQSRQRARTLCAVEEESSEGGRLSERSDAAACASRPGPCERLGIVRRARPIITS